VSVELAPVQAVIFGLHGILLADTKLDRLLTSELLQNWGIVLRPGEYREVFLERSDALGLRMMLERRGRAVNDEIIAELVQKKQHLYRSYLEREIPRIEGVEDCLQQLQARGIPCLVVSNESQSPWIVEHLGYGHYFKALL
jgi:beta-phosphoglucomutase-like phosphatase (HAD superfamily)